MATVFFESERLWFRPPDLDEAPLLQRWINDAAVRRQLNRRFPLGLEGEREWIRKATGQAGPTLPEVVALLFGVKGEAEPIGSTGLFGFDWVVREAEWGILIGSAGWFFTWFLLFCKTFPAVAITELKEMIEPKVKGTLEAK